MKFLTQILFFFIFAICTFGFSYIVKRFVSVDDETVPFVTAATTLILVAFALMLNVVIYIYFMYLALGFVGFLKVKELFTNQAWKTYSIYFILPCFILFILLINSSYGNWDEFSHWGLIARYISNNGSLPSPGDGIYFLEYPIGLAAYYSVSSFLYKYLFYETQFLESITYYANAVFCVSGFFVCTKYIKTNRRLVFNTCYITLLLLPFAFGYSYKSIYADFPLGVSLGIAFSSVVLYSASRTKIILFTLSSILLILIKVVGFVYVLFQCIFAFSLSVYSEEKFKNLIQYISIIAFINIIIMIVWKFHLQSIQATDAVPLNLSLQTIANAGFDLFANNKSQVLVNLIEHFKPYDIDDGVYKFKAKIILFYFIFFIPFVLYIFVKSSVERLIVLRVHIAVTICFLLYIFILFYTYTKILTVDEGLQLASCDRYIGSYFFAVIFLLLHLILKLSGIELYKKLFIFVAILMVVLIFSSKNIYKFIQGESELSYLRFVIQNKIDQANSIGIDFKNYKTAFVARCDDGRAFQIFRYEISPNSVYPDTMWSPGPKCSINDIWARDKLSYNNWYNDLISHGVQYIFVFSADEDMRKNFFDVYLDNSISNKIFLIKIPIDTTKKLELINIEK